MRNEQRSSMGIHIILWILQVLLAAGLLFGGVMKLFMPVEKLAAMWPWTGEVAPVSVTLLGVLDLLGAAGILLPSILRIKVALTGITAICILVLMVCAGIFHMARGEASEIGINVFFAILAAFISWGRVRKVPITSHTK